MMRPSKGRDVIELRIPSRLGYEKVAMDAAAALARKMGFSPERINDLRTALAEACVNAIEHGNKGDARLKVVVLLSVGKDNLEIRVKDRGEPFSPPEHPPDIQEVVEEGKSPRGWGMFIIKSLMDEVEFTVNSNIGNVTRMVIRLQKD